jgi:hypothetical protein
VGIPLVTQGGGKRKGSALPTYVIRTNHSAETCPSANSKVLDLVQKVGPEIPTIAERLGVKIVAGPLVMGSEHESVAIVETERVETVNDFLLEAGLVQWNSVRVSMAQPLPDALAELDKLPAGALF